MSTKGQVGPIGFILLFLVFIIIWFVWLGSWVGEWGERMVIDTGMTGVEAFFYANLNLVILFAAILGIMGYFYLRG